MRLPCRLLLVAIAANFCVLGGDASAQHGQDVRPPAQTVSPSGANPTTESVHEERLLKELGKLQGRVTIPDYKAAVLQQPQGRDYQFFHERVLPWLAGILIVATVLALVGFYLLRGRIGLEARETGIKIRRFSVLERLTHWMT